MNMISTISAPAAAEISGAGSFFGSCQIAAGNFEAIFQSAVTGGETEQPSGFALEDFGSFSEFIEGQGKSEVLERLQEILGDEAGEEAFEIAVKIAKSDYDFKSLSPEQQEDLYNFVKAFEMPFDIQKGMLENWVKDVKSIFGDIKTELEEEPQAEEGSKNDAFAAMPYEDFKNMKLLAAKMEIKSEDVPKFEALINSLLKNGLLTSQDLNNALAAMSHEDFKNMGFLVAEMETKSEDAPKIDEASIKECIEELWKLVENENEAEITNLVNETVNLIDEEFVSSAKETDSGLAKEQVSGSAKEQLSGSAKEQASGSAKEHASGSAKEQVSGSAKEHVSGSAKEQISGSSKEQASGSPKEHVFASSKEQAFGSSKEQVSGSAKEQISGLAKETDSGLTKESVPDLEKRIASGLVKELEISERNISDSIEDSREPEKADLIKMYLLLLTKKKKHSEEGGEDKEEKGEEELAIEEEEEGSEEKDRITLEDANKKSLAFEKDEDLDGLDSLLDPKMAGKNKHKNFKPEIQMTADQTQHTLQSQPQQMRQKVQVQPEIRTVWEGSEFKIELVNPKTGEKLQSTQTAMPQNMQERIQEFEIIKQVVAKAKFITTPTGEQKIFMQLKPDHLGSIDMRITLNNGEMQIQARVDTHVAQQALENQIGLLREGLEKQGINLDRLEVSVEQRERQEAWSLAERQEQHEQEQRQRNRRHRHGREMHLAASVAKDANADTGRRLGYNTMEYLA